MLTFLFVSFSTLITIVNPVGALGPFLAMTVGETELRRRQIAWRASIVSGSVLAGSALVGAFIFKFYGITLPALKVAGGILLFFVAFDMINARPSRTKQTAEEQSEGTMKEDIAVFSARDSTFIGPRSDCVDVYVGRPSKDVGVAHCSLRSRRHYGSGGLLNSERSSPSRRDAGADWN